MPVRERTPRSRKRSERPILLPGGDSGSPLTQSNRRGSLNNRLASSSSEELQPRPKEKRDDTSRRGTTTARTKKDERNNVRRCARGLKFTRFLGYHSTRESSLCNLSTGAQLMLNDKTERNPRKSGEWCVGPTKKPSKNAASKDTANCKAPSYRKLPSTRPKNARRIARMSPSLPSYRYERIAHRMRVPSSLGGSGSSSSCLLRRFRLSVASIVLRR